MLEEASTSRGK